MDLAVIHLHPVSAAPPSLGHGSRRLSRVFQTSFPPPHWGTQGGPRPDGLCYPDPSRSLALCPSGRARDTSKVSGEVLQRNPDQMLQPPRLDLAASQTPKNPKHLESCVLDWAIKTGQSTPKVQRN